MTFYATCHIFEQFSCAGRDAALIGPNENQFAVLDDDKTNIMLHILPSGVPQEAVGSNGALDPNSFSETKAVSDGSLLAFTFETAVDCIFSSPIGG